MTEPGPAQESIQSIVDGHDVVLFMKGTGKFPQCGFSSRIASILQYLGVKFEDVNVLDDDNLREGIKTFSNWPTIPQLYVKGEFLGGCDIVTEMTMSGELDTVLADKGVEFDREAAKRIRESNKDS